MPAEAVPGQSFGVMIEVTERLIEELRPPLEQRLVQEIQRGIEADWEALRLRCEGGVPA
jgi:hypothetical protein